MFDNLQTGSLADLSDDELELAMGAAPTNKKPKKSTDAKAPEDEDGTGKKPKVSKDKSESDKNKTISTLSKNTLNSAFSTPEEDEDNEDNDPEGGVVEDDDEDETPKFTKKKVAKKPEVKEEDEDDDEPIEDDESAEEDDDSAEDDDDENEEETGDITVGNFLKARVDLLIKKGEWLPWEGMKDDEEWTEETFAEMEVQQRSHQREKMREEILEGFGPYGRRISEFTENGGDPDELIEVFRQQQQVQALSIDTAQQQRDVVFKYETEFLNKNPERVKKYIANAEAEKFLAEEAKDAKEKMEAYWKTEAEDMEASQEETVKQQRIAAEKSRAKFSSDVTTLVNGDKTIPDDEKKTLLKLLTKFDKKLPNGSVVNEFYSKFAEFRKNLPDYINLVRFVNDPKKFMKSIEIKGKNEGVEKSFSLVRQGNKNKKSKSNEAGRGDKPKKSGFRLVY